MYKIYNIYIYINILNYIFLNFIFRCGFLRDLWDPPPSLASMPKFPSRGNNYEQNIYVCVISSSFKMFFRCF